MNSQYWGDFEPFDPAEGKIVRHPPGSASGYWAGAPGVLFDSIDHVFYLVYRVRRPRGIVPDRGAEIHLARSGDGLEFETIWSGTKGQLNTTSIERCAIRRISETRWLLFVSYVDPADGRWRIDYVESKKRDGFDLSQRRPVVTSADLDVDGVKDPFVFQDAGRYHMIVSIATPVANSTHTDLHSTHDAYNTGLIRSATGLLTSNDGTDWNWDGEILGPSDTGWDKYCSRIGTIWRQEEVWFALYDGSADVSENYEERVGLASSFDLKTFHRVSDRGPIMQSPAGEKTALRYFDVLSLGESTFFYYEMARPDGSHDLRVFRRSS